MQQYVEYTGNRIFLRHLAKPRRTLTRDIKLLPYYSPDTTAQEYVDRLEKKRAKARKQIQQYQKGPKPTFTQDRSKHDLQTQRRAMQIDALLRPIISSPHPQIAGLSATDPIILGRSGQCELYVHQINEPFNFIKFDSSPNHNDSSWDANIIGAFYTAENAIECDGALTDQTHWYSQDPSDYVQIYALHEYRVPPPACDSLLKFWVNFDYRIHDFSPDAESGLVYVTPFIFAEPQGGLPKSPVPLISDSLWQRCYLNSIAEEWQYIYYEACEIDDGERSSYRLGPTGPIPYSDYYYIKAGESSNIYLGMQVLFAAREGTIRARPLTILELTNSFYFSGPGVYYIMWPESMFPNW